MLQLKELCLLRLFAPGEPFTLAELQEKVPRISQDNLLSLISQHTLKINDFHTLHYPNPKPIQKSKQARLPLHYQLKHAEQLLSKYKWIQKWRKKAQQNLQTQQLIDKWRNVCKDCAVMLHQTCMENGLLNQLVLNKEMKKELKRRKIVENPFVYAPDGFELEEELQNEEQDEEEEEQFTIKKLFEALQLDMELFPEYNEEEDLFDN